MAERLGDHHPPFHAAGQFNDPGVSLFPQRKFAQQLFDIGGVGRPPEESAAEGRRLVDGRENVERDLLRHEPDNRPRGAIVPDDVVSINEDFARSHRHRAADDPDQRRLAGAVRAQESKNLASGDLQIDRIEGDEA